MHPLTDKLVGTSRRGERQGLPEVGREGPRHRERHNVEKKRKETQKAAFSSEQTKFFSGAFHRCLMFLTNHT